MSVHTGVDPRLLTQIGDDVAQLTRPIHMAAHRRLITHPPLLTQLRQAIEPGHLHPRPERRTPPRSQPPANLSAVDALATIYVELADWHQRLRLPSPPRDADWQIAALRQLVGAAPTLAPAITEWLAIDLHTWWRTAAVHSGWRPDDLIRLR